MGRQFAETQLIAQALRKTFVNGEGIVLGQRVLAAVVHAQLVRGDGVVLLQFIQGNLRALLLALGIGRIVQDRILLQFGADALLQLLHGKFDQFDGLNLERRKFLLLLEFKPLSERRHPTVPPVLLQKPPLPLPPPLLLPPWPSVRWEG